jgi:D-3-phosphoglycerate dehydrogenase / 2-oxoglutarate reductase
MKPLNECRVLVTATSYGKNDPTLFSHLEDHVGKVVYNTSGKPLDSRQLQALLPDIDGCIAGLDCIDRQAIQSANILRVIARYGVGVDAIDLAAAKEHGIIVTNTPGANSVSVAELAVGMMLALARNLVPATLATKAGQWPRLNGVSLEGKTIGVLGFGSIGRNVAKRLCGFDCTILAYDPFLPEGPGEYGTQLVPQEAVIEQADFLSLHCPLTGANRGMVNDAFLARMKPGAFLINTARGELIDEEALLRALQQGRLNGAALDVFARQPPDPLNPLLALPQVIATPHTGAHSDSATNGMGWGALVNLLAVLQGEEPLNRVI